VPPGTGITEGARFLLPVNGVGVPALSTLPFGTASAPELAVIKGRRPTRDGEVAIGPKTASELGVGIGDTVAIGDDHAPVVIVGEALFPNDVHAEFDQGIWLTPSRFKAVVPEVGPENLFDGPTRMLFLQFPNGTDVPAAIGALEEQLAGKVQNVLPADVPVELTNLSNVKSLPWVLAAFLGLLAIAAVSHVLVSSSHRRSRDLAVLRAIGFTRRSSRLAVNAQATVIAIVGLGIGVPLGVVVGRVGWRLVAERVPLQDVGPIPAVALVLVVPVTLVLLNALALWPARSVARLRPAEVLRDE
jgi:FtsX-like permease family